MAKKLFVNAKTEAGLNAAVAEGTLNAEVAFIEEQGKEGIHAKGKTYQTIPSNSKDGQVLMASNGKGVWVDFDILDSLSYGVEWKPSVADPVLTRIGNSNLHRTLPIQSGMKGCILNPTTGKVVYWLNEDDWRFRKDPILATGSLFLYDLGDPGLIVFDDPTLYETLTVGQYIKMGTHVGEITEIVSESIELEDTTITIPKGAVGVNWFDDFSIEDLGGATQSFEIGSKLNGYDGEVYVYVPGFYIRSWDEADRKAVRISTTKIDDTWEYQPPIFVGAYKDTILREEVPNMGYLSTLDSYTPICVVNYEDYCRGGDIQIGSTSNSIFNGKCITGVKRENFRTLARKNNKEIMSYRQYKNILYWLYVIEYANFNCQAPYTPSLTAEGFHQGGLGEGITTIDYDTWTHYNSASPLTTNGTSNSLGNKTGIKRGTLPSIYYVTRWRGIENPFGDTWHCVDGIIIDCNTNVHPDNMAYVHTTNDPTKYLDAVSDFDTSHPHVATITAGYIREFDLGTTSEITPKLVGGNSTQYKCDYNDPATGSSQQAHMLLLGGRADSGAGAGLGCFDFSINTDFVSRNVGYRTDVISKEGL